MYVLQVFYPASVIFTGIGVFLSVSIISIPSVNYSHAVYLKDCTRRRSE